jgi:MbtH protein
MAGSNPFDDEDGQFQVLRNDEGQYSLWPVQIDLPAGWTVAHGTDSRAACLEFVERTWTDMRPRSLVRATEAGGDAGTGAGADPGTDPGR